MTPTGLRFNSCRFSVPASFFVAYAEYMLNASKPIRVERKATIMYGYEVKYSVPFTGMTNAQMPVLSSHYTKIITVAEIKLHFTAPLIGLRGLNLYAKMSKTTGITVDSSMPGKTLPVT
jgi:hypothetical protein